MRWVDNVALMETEKVHTGFWWVDVKKMSHLEYLGVYGRIILKWISKKHNGSQWIDLAQDRDKW